MRPLTEIQRTLLTAASARADGLLVPPDRLTGGARERVAATLRQRQLVAEVTVVRAAPSWGRSARGRSLGLRITHEGRAAVGQDPQVVSPRPTAPRAASKAAILIDLLARQDGASLDDLTAATGWLSHTVRAALTRLRQRGHTLVRAKDTDGRSVYRITGAGEG